MWSDEMKIYWKVKVDRQLSKLEQEVQSGVFLKQSEAEVLMDSKIHLAYAQEQLEKHDLACKGCQFDLRDTD